MILRILTSAKKVHGLISKMLFAENSRKSWLLSFVILLFPIICIVSLVSSAVFSQNPKGEEPQSAKTKDNSMNINTPDWRLLEYDPGDYATNVKLVMYEFKSNNPWWEYLVRKERVEIETGSELVKCHMTNYLCDSYDFRLPAKKPSCDMVKECIGEIHITTHLKRHFMIGIAVGGYAMQSTKLSDDNCFVNWGLSKMIDKLLRDHGQKGFNGQVFINHVPHGSAESDVYKWQTIDKKFKDDGKIVAKSSSE
jgi:hypothetical protein